MSRFLVRDLVELAQRDYEVDGRSFARVAAFQTSKLIEQIGSCPAKRLTFEVIEDYKRARIAQGRARCTVNNELTVLKKGLRIAVDAKLLKPRDVPVIRLLRRGRPRTGFLHVQDFYRIADELRPDVRDICEFAYWSGWRRGECFGLTWDRTNNEWAWCFDKNGDVKQAPLKGHLGEVLRRRRERRRLDCSWFFHRKGKPIKSVRDGWNAAVKRAGLERTYLFHDMRRSFCRNAIRAGIDRDTVMKLSGHRTDDIFRRYNIQDEDDLLDAAERLSEFGRISGRRRSLGD